MAISNGFEFIQRQTLDNISMFCSCCKSDVAAKLDQDDRTLLCTHCGTEIQSSGNVSTVNNATRDAQSLLQRWADPQIFDAPDQEVASPEPKPVLEEKKIESTIVELSEISQERESPIKSVQNEKVSLEPVEELERIESITKNEPLASKEEIEPSVDVVNRILDESSLEPPRSYVVERSDMQILNRPILTTTAFEVQQSINDRHTSRFNWRRFIGQSFAYIGTSVLSVGGAAVVWSFYGGPENVVPAGWIMVFVGQLMLFLGLVTLITSGVKELRSDVVNRVDFIRSLLSRLDPPAQLPEKPQFQARKESRVESRNESDVVKP